MKARVKKDIEITLVLNEKEALWLKGLVQNPIGCSYEEEREEDRDIRHSFWDTLKEVKYE